MSPDFQNAVRGLNRLMATGYDLSKLPDFRTNAGWKLTYSDSDVPGKVGLVLSKDLDYALIVGRIEGNIFIDAEEEASDDTWFTYFYSQLEVFLSRTLAIVPAHRDGTELTWEQLRQIENDMLSTAWQRLPYRVDINKKIFFHGSAHGLEVRRNHRGNGVINVEHHDGNHFFIQFENNKVRAFKVKGFARNFVMSKINELIKFCYGA